MDAKKTGELIATLRRERNLNQSELAELIGVTNKAISRWETGRGYPDIETFPKISEVLNISIPELLRGERTKQPEPEVLEQSPHPLDRPGDAERDSSIETVCQYAGEQSRRQKKKVILLTALLSGAICLSALFFIVTEVLPVIGQFCYSIMGSSDCVVARDYRSLTYLGDTYVPLPMNGYSCVEGDRMVDECRVQGAGFIEKLFFGEMLYELENVPNHEIVYLRTDYDYCISEYYVLASEYDRYTQMLKEAECSSYYSSHYNESWYRWEQELDPVLSAAIHDPEQPAVPEVPDISRRLDIRLYDENHMFFYEAGMLLQATDGYYWCPAEFPSHGYGMHPGCAWTEQYYPIDGFDNELSALFSN